MRIQKKYVHVLSKMPKKIQVEIQVRSVRRFWKTKALTANSACTATGTSDIDRAAVNDALSALTGTSAARQQWRARDVQSYSDECEDNQRLKGKNLKLLEEWGAIARESDAPGG